MYDAVFTEQLGVPAAVIGNHGFANDARSACSGKGMPGIRFVPETVPCECTISAQAEAGMGAVLDDIIGALTRPLTRAEQYPEPGEVEKTDRIVFKGDIHEVNRFYYKRGWTDGFPIIPTTEEAVREMLTGTDLPPDHVVGKMVPRLGKATVEKIAIGAVMAGALPTYMPVLIAGVQALIDPKSGYDVTGVSTGSWTPFWVINGPIRNQLHINSGTGALSPGDIANATIGRAMGLIIKNVGGIRKGMEDMGVLGNPGKYAMVTAENEEASPWEPLHVEQGFNKEDSCVTLSFPNSYGQIWPYGSDDKGILRGVISNIMPGRGLGTLMVTPMHAQILASFGWTKREIIAYIAEYARVPAYRHPRFYNLSTPTPMRPPIDAHDLVSMVRSPEIGQTGATRIIVAGGPGAFIGMISGAGGPTTKKIELPAEWENLVKKYRDVVPTYLRY